MSVAAEHGLHRWHKGYGLQELIKEIGTYWQHYPQLSNLAIQQVYEQVSRLFREAVQGSVLKHDELKATSASERVNSLQQALTKISQLEQERVSLLRMTSHDLRGGMSIVSGAASLITLPDSSQEDRQQLLDMMQRNLNSVQQLL